jgi:hypothetical protein
MTTLWQQLQRLIAGVITAKEISSTIFDYAEQSG